MTSDNPTSTEDSSSYDLLIFGATSFVGQLVCEYLVEQYADQPLSWAMAGRSKEKLQAVYTSLMAATDKSVTIPQRVADARDEDSLRHLCQQARVIVSTVGPYALYGETLVKVCAETGTDYCDLSGETDWMHNMIGRYQQSARESGARLVHCCGFDSIPSDMGVMFTQQLAEEKFGHYCQQINMRVTAAEGGFSGGTVASMINGVKRATSDSRVREIMTNPYSLCPDNHQYQVRQEDPQFEYDKDLDTWVGPFVMAAINTRVVFRSNALLDYPYGRDFRYSEGMGTGPGHKGRSRARQLYWGLKLFNAALLVPPLRWLLQTFLLPKPGEGPDREKRENGRYQLEFIGRTADGLSLHTRLKGKRDPGYGATARMLTEAALCLAETSTPGGFWTPATALGRPLLERLQQKADMTFELIDHGNRKENQGNL